MHQNVLPHVRRSNVSRDINRIRHIAQVEPANPRTLQELEIPQEYRQIGVFCNTLIY